MLDSSPAQHLVEIVADVDVGFVEQIFPARLLRHPEAGAVPGFHLGDQVGLG